MNRNTFLPKPVHEIPGYNPPEFRSGFTRVTIRDGAIAIEFQPLGVADVLKKELPRRGA